MRVAIVLLLSVAAAVSGRCLYDRWRRFVFAKGQAKVKVYSEDVVKDLRVELVSFRKSTCILQRSGGYLDQGWGFGFGNTEN
ncbi:hypothetical protein AAVH_33168 [Aphelenchoides avenae]|nr:hypothetical protein AAVH_33168 [Aphelenchus avenae]